MENLADRLLELLCHSEHDVIFQQLVDDLIGSPVRYQEGGTIAVHMFPQQGVSLTSSNTRFFEVRFDIEPASFKDTLMSTYSDSLPFGIGKDYLGKHYGCRDVQNLLGQPDKRNPCGEDYMSELYTIESLYVVFWYSLPSEELACVRIMSQAFK